MKPVTSPVKSDSTQLEFPHIDRIVVYFSTGSLPPQYAYWYEITLTPDSVHYVREDCNGMTHHESAITPEQFDEVADIYRSYHIRSCEPSSPQPVGGKRYELYLYNGEECLIGGDNHTLICPDPTIPVLPFCPKN